ncbi:MAG: hypothetical protein HY553_22720 [Elusimicrobia bacterium]|nr:hypothetical protein [Elusimicrobiota bacterium]
MNNVFIPRALAALTLAGALATIGVAQEASQDWSKLHGTWSGVQQPKQLVITDEATWKAVWAEHAQNGAAPAAAPAVDFTKETVVAIFQGSRMTSSAVETRIERKDGKVVVVVKEGAKPFSMPVACQPFEIVKLAKAPVTIQYNGKTSGPAPKIAGAETARETGLRDAVARASGHLKSVFTAKPAETVGFDGGAPAATTLAGVNAAFGGLQVSQFQLPPPPGEQQQEPPKKKQGNLPPPPGEKQEPPKKKQGNLPPPPGDGQDRQNGRGGSLPPPPGEGQRGNLPPPPGDNGNQGGNLPPPPQYRPRPSRPGNLPPPPGGNIPIEDSGVTTVGYWHVFPGAYGWPVDRYGDWSSETASAGFSRGGSETGVTQGTRYTANLSSREYRRRYRLYYRYVGYNCHPNDPDNCERWEEQRKYFYEDTRYGRSSQMSVEVGFAQDKALLPWEKESFSIKYDGSRVWIDQHEPSYTYSVRGPIVDQQTGAATMTLTAGAKILRAPESGKVNAYIVNEGGKLKLVIEDYRTREYAGEALDVAFEVWRDDPAGWRNLLGRDTKMAERTKNGPVRINTAAGAQKHVIDLGVSGSAEYYLDTWSFRRANSKLSSGDWVNRGKGNRVKM